MSKVVCNQGVVQRGQCECSSDADDRTFGAKNLGFQNLWCIRTDKGG